MARLIDEVNIAVKAGTGGKGCESRAYISQKKFIATGGEGGRGGNVILRADSNVTTLKSFLYRCHFEADSGGPGGSNHKKGKGAGHLVVAVPCGTMIYDTEKQFLLRDLVSPGDEVVLVEGGKGGAGNEGKKEATAGGEGRALQITLRLKIPAEAFLVGFPNSGKSKLLNRLTAAHVKEESYPFSTKYPELGVFETPDYEKIHLCELPALYRDSPIGRGVGFDFLKHLGRARFVILMLDPLSSFAASIREGYETLLEVMRQYAASRPAGPHGRSLLEIPRAVVISKMDLAEARRRVEGEKFRPEVPLFLISGETGEGIEPLMRYIAHQMREKTNA